MPLIADIFPLLITHLLPSGSDPVPLSLLALSATSRHVRDACLPFLFADARWPQRSKADRDHGLLFYPESLWPYFRSLPSLILFSCLSRPQAFPSRMARRVDRARPHSLRLS